MFGCGQSRKRFDLFAPKPHYPKKRADGSITSLDRTSLSNMLAQHSQRPFTKAHLSFMSFPPWNCLYSTYYIFWNPGYVYILWSDVAFFLYIIWYKKQQQNKFYFQYFILVRDNLGIYQLFNVLHVTMVILVFSECFYVILMKSVR